jgi:DNA polymerase bacteriophage-type
VNLWIDTETRSTVKLAHGTYKYATGAQVIVVAWAVDDDPVAVWDCTADNIPPKGLIRALLDMDTITSHGAEFDRTLLETAHWYASRHINIDRWRCSMATARAHSLPGKLAKLCEIFQLPVDMSKDADGKRLIGIFCSPRDDGKYNDRHTHPQDWKKFLDYAGQDIVAMRELMNNHIPKWNRNAFETGIFKLDAVMNARGVEIDLDMAHGMIKTVNRAQARLKGITNAVTDGDVLSTTQRARLKQYLSDGFGVDLPDMKAETIERRLDDPELPEVVKELLRMRLQATKSSTAKYKRVIASEVNGRLYGLLLYYGARPGRWSGRIFQPHNTMRPKHGQAEIDAFIAAVKCDAADIITDEPIAVAASSMRGVIVARANHKLCVADLSNIEGRGLPWMAGEKWKLAAFAAFDRGEGHDMYKIAYARMFNIDPQDVEDDSDERQVGKVVELACGYYGGVGAFVSMAAIYRVDLEAMADAAWNTLPPRVRSQAAHRWAFAVENKRTYQLSQRVWTVCMAFVLLWREAHPATVQFWYDVQGAAEQAILRPNHVFTAGKLKFDRKGNWLRMHLPSGRYILYPGPRFDENGISYLGINAYSHQWCRLRTYSGRLVQNADEGISRDQLAATLPSIEAAGYCPTLTVHDSAICEPPDDPAFTHERLIELIATQQPWNVGLPLAAKGFTDYRYRKEK